MAKEEAYLLECIEAKQTSERHDKAILAGKAGKAVDSSTCANASNENRSFCQYIAQVQEDHVQVV